jgi:hypothetical protein
MWHWNSLWAPAPGDPPAIDDPKLYRAPWTPEQAFVLQSRAWDTLVSASRAWWSFWMASLSPPGQPPVGELTPKTDIESPPPPHRADAKRRTASPRTRAPAPGAKRAPHPESRSGLQARKR